MKQEGGGKRWEERHHTLTLSYLSLFMAFPVTALPHPTNQNQPWPLRPGSTKPSCITAMAANINWTHLPGARRCSIGRSAHVTFKQCIHCSCLRWPTAATKVQRSLVSRLGWESRLRSMPCYSKAQACGLCATFPWPRNFWSSNSPCLHFQLEIMYPSNKCSRCCICVSFVGLSRLNTLWSLFIWSLHFSY